MPILRVSNLKKCFGGIVAVSQVSFSMTAGQIVSVIGPNGAGKTTFFNIISGFYQPDEGQILFDNRNITGATPEKAAACGIARTFQNIRLFPELTAAENILVGMHLRLSSPLWQIILNTFRMRREETEAREEALELLDYVGLSGKESHQAKNLPYGEQRRLEIARALALKPKLLLLDEPTAGMNPRETEDMKHLILKLRDELKLTILLIEHDMKIVMGISDHITVLNYGEVIAEGTPGEIRSNPTVVKAYLGEEAV